MQRCIQSKLGYFVRVKILILFFSSIIIFPCYSLCLLLEMMTSEEVFKNMDSYRILIVLSFIYRLINHVSYVYDGALNFQLILKKDLIPLASEEHVRGRKDKDISRYLQERTKTWGINVLFSSSSTGKFVQRNWG